MTALLQIFVSYKTSALDVSTLEQCISKLDKSKVKTAILVNDYKPDDPINRLAKIVDYFIPNDDNLGYGSTINRFVRSLPSLPEYLAFLNTDISWEPGTFEKSIGFMNNNKSCVLMVPKILNPDQSIAYLCKRNPTLLALISRRFIPDFLKTKALKKYDRWFCMRECDYSLTIESSYLSGCCMVVRSLPFIDLGGFDERYFLYLEDADLTRSMQKYGSCLHVPSLSIVHQWQRGSYNNIKLMYWNILSFFIYSIKWGWKLF